MSGSSGAVFWVRPASFRRLGADQAWCLPARDGDTSFGRFGRRFRRVVACFAGRKLTSNRFLGV